MYGCCSILQSVDCLFNIRFNPELKREHFQFVIVDVVVGLKDREFGEVWVELDGERRSEYPRSFTKVNMVYHVEGDVPEKLVRRTIKKSHEKYCSVSNSLSREIEITWELILHDK